MSPLCSFVSFVVKGLFLLWLNDFYLPELNTLFEDRRSCLTSVLLCALCGENTPKEDLRV
jgi:hypothetical protein